MHHNNGEQGHLKWKSESYDEESESESILYTEVTYWESKNENQIESEY